MCCEFYPKWVSKKKNKKNKLGVKDKVGVNELPYYRYCPVASGYILKEGYMNFYDEIIPVADLAKKRKERDARDKQLKDIFKNSSESNQSFDDTTKHISREEFKISYTDCIFCNEPLKDFYEDSVIIDTKSAVCPDCVKTSEIDNLSVFNMANSI